MKHKLDSIKLYKGVSGHYRINAEYLETDDNGNISKLTIHGIPLPLNNYPTIELSREIGFSQPDLQIDIGFGFIECDSETTAERTTIYTPVKEMTIAEIEKELGHKIKIIGDNSNGKER